MSHVECIEILRENYQKLLLTKRETAKELSISEATIDRLRQSGKISSKKILGSVMFSIDEIARFVEEA
jgi:hypothetical protein